MAKLDANQALNITKW